MTHATTEHGLVCPGRTKLSRPAGCRPGHTWPAAAFNVAAAISGLASLAALSTLTAPAQAIQPKHWVHTTEADFEPGTAEGTVVTNHGDVRLAPKLDHLPLLPDGANAVFDIVRVGDWVYVATGPRGVIARYPANAQAVDPETLNPNTADNANVDADNADADDDSSDANGGDDRAAAKDEDAHEGDHEDTPEADTRPRAQTVADLGDEQVFAMIEHRGRLLLAISGSPTRLAYLDPQAAPEPDQPQPDNDQPDENPPQADQHGGHNADVPDPTQTLVTLPGIDFVWDMVADPGDQGDAPIADNPGDGGRLILATGGEGQLLRVDLDNLPESAGDPDTQSADQPAGIDAAEQAHENPGQADDAPDDALPYEVLLDTPQANLLCLTVDTQGRLIFGTDTDGLVYRLAFEGEDGTPTPFVLFDAPQPEIGAVLAMPDGSVFVGTADAEQARPGRLAKPVDESAGRPDADAQAHSDAGGGADARDDGASDGDNAQQAAGPTGGQTTDTDAIATDAAATSDSAATPADSGGDAAKSSETAQASADKASADQASVDQAPATPAPPTEDAAETSDTEPPAPPAITAEQRDRLRDVIRSRLEAARDSGRMAMEDGSGGSSARLARRPTRAARSGGGSGSASGGGKAPDGNMVYRIDAQGFIRGVFQESVMVLGLAPSSTNPTGEVFILTGNEGQLYTVDVDRAERTLLLDLDPMQLSASWRDEDGRLWLASSNPAAMFRLSGQLDSTGTYESVSLDARQVAMWGRLLIDADLPAGTALAVQTRSGNVEDPEAAEYAWSPWSEPVEFKVDDPGRGEPIELTADAPPARFIRYRLTLTGNAQAPEGEGPKPAQATPVVKQADLTYVIPNLPPLVPAIKAEYAKPKADPEQDLPDADATMKVEWAAADPNDDRLLFKLQFRRLGHGLSSEALWLTIADDLTKNTYDWATSRVPDGRYELRVVADDRRDNPPDMARTFSRVSDPVVVDNTKPVFSAVEVSPRAADGGEAGGTVIWGRVTDELSAVRQLAYVVNDGERYTPFLSEDLILDSTRESFRVTLPDLPAGPAVVTLRAVDGRGNVAYHPVTFRIDR